MAPGKVSHNRLLLAVHISCASVRMNIHNIRERGQSPSHRLLRADQATFPDYASDTISNRDIVGDRLTGGSVNNRRIAYDKAILLAVRVRYRLPSS